MIDAVSGAELNLNCLVCFVVFNGRFYARGHIIHLDEFGQTFVVRLVIRL